MTGTSFEPRSTIKGFREWMAVGVMLSGGTMLGLVVAAMSPVTHDIAAYFAGKGDGDLVAQMIVTVPSLGVIAGGLICGWLIGLFGTKRFLLGALAVFGASGSAGLYLDSAMMLLITRFILGLALSGIVTAMITMIGEYFTPEARSRILGYQSAVGAASGVGIIFVAGLIGEWGGWRAPFALYLLSIVAMVLGIFYLPAMPRRVRTAAKPPTDWMALLRLWPIYVIIIPMFLAVYMPNIQVSFLLRDDGIIRPQIQGYVILTGAATVALAALTYGTLSRRLSSRQILMACFVFQGLGIVIMGLSHTVPLIALGCGVLGIGTGIANPLISDLIVARTTPEMRGPAIGLSYTTRYLGDFINPWIMFPLGRALGLHIAFVWVGIAFLLAVAVAIVIRQIGPKAAPVAG